MNAAGRFAISVTLALPGVAQTKPPSATAQDVAKLAAAVSGLQRTVDDLKLRLDSLASDAAELGWDVAVVKGRYAEATLDPAKPNQFVVIHADGVPVLLSLGEVTPYLDGYKASIQIGNLSSMNITRAVMTVRWAPRAESLPKGSNWVKTIQKTELSVTALQSGYWNTREVILPHTKASEIGWMAVSLELGQMASK